MTDKPRLLVSACLLGTHCRYDGGHCYSEEIEILKKKYELVPVCPEELGGLPTPRDPAEQIGNKVISNKGHDVTENYQLGANRALEVFEKENCQEAILKSKSPMCGLDYIYDGTFSNKLVEGDGVLVKLLKSKNIKINKI